MTGLAIPTLASEVPGNFLTGALWNGNVYNLGTFLLNPPDFVGYQAAAQAIPNNAWTSLAFDTTTVDTYGGHSNTTNNSRYTCQAGVPGYYTVCGVYAYSPNVNNFRAIRMIVNGTPVFGSSIWSPPNANGQGGVATPTKDVFLNVGDYVEVQAYQSVGGALNTNTAPDLCCGLWVRFSHA